MSGYRVYEALQRHDIEALVNVVALVALVGDRSTLSVQAAPRTATARRWT